MEKLKPGEFYCFGRKVSPPQQGIHPRVRNARAAFAKVNTSAKPNPAIKQRTIAAITEHLERHPRDGMSAAHLSKLKAA